MITQADAKAWATAIMAILVVIEAHVAFSLGPITAEGITDIIVIIGTSAVWLMPRLKSGG